MISENNDRPRLSVISPFDGTHIADIEMSNADDVHQKLERAVTVFKNRDGWLAAHKRIDILGKLAVLVDNEAEEFSMLIAKEGGKPLVDARIEVARAVNGIHLAIEELSHIMRGEEIPMGQTLASVGRKAHTVYEPIGVVVAVSAFNHPLNLIIHQVVPAIAVGCPVIIKPAGTTPLTCARFIELVHQSGLSEDWCQLCVCDNDVAEILVTSKRIGFFTFIGSARVGWMLKSKLAPGVRCALEHGGAAPVIVDHTANLEATIPSLIKGGFYHAGQVCVSVQRVFIEQSILPEVIKRLIEGVEHLNTGDPTLDATDVGPLILPREVKRVATWVDEAIDDGAKLLAGGEVVGDTQAIGDTMYAPTILLNPPVDAKVSTSEIFGPVICLYSYTDLNEALDRANSLDVAFQAAVYTSDLQTANYCIERLDASAVMVNDHSAFRVDWMPFAGRRTSGYGVGGIGYTMHDMVHAKMAVINNL